MSRRNELTGSAHISSERPPGFVLHERRKGLLRRSVDSVLQCESVPLTKLAERYGTPLYIYSATTIRERFAAFDNAFRNVPHTICYSVKANSNLSILRLLARQGCGFDVVSGGELERVLAVDRRAARKIVFSGVGKSREEMTAALKAGILLFNVESESELWTLAECAARLHKIARIALRVNPDVAADTHPYISTGLRKHKFGVPISIARTLYAKASATRYLKVAGVSAAPARRPGRLRRYRRRPRDRLSESRTELRGLCRELCARRDQSPARSESASVTRTGPRDCRTRGSAANFCALQKTK